MMGKDGGYPGRKQEKRQAKEVLGFAHPIQIHLFEEIHAHSDPLELDTNDCEFVPKIEIVTKLSLWRGLQPAGFSTAEMRKPAG
jgi:hypothetical protein